MKRVLTIICIFATTIASGQQNIFMPQNIKKAYTNETRSMDGKPGSKYWQNKGVYSINISLAPPSKTIKGTETIIYTNNSPKPLNGLPIKLILNIHTPGAERQNATPVSYLTKGIVIDNF